MLQIPDSIKSGADTSIRPNDDLYRFVNGTWLDTYQIPEDESRAGTFINLRNLSEARCREIIEELAQKESVQSGYVESDADKIGVLFNSFMNEELIDSLGLAPLEEDLCEVREANTILELLQALSKLEPTGVSGPFEYTVDADFNDPSRQMFMVTQGGIGLPDEAYYRIEHHKATLESYRVHLSKMFELFALASAEKSKELADRVVDLETRFAKSHRDVVAMRDVQKINNPMSFAEFTKLAPEFDWQMWREAIMLPAEVDNLLVTTPEVITAQVKELFASEIETVRAWVYAKIMQARAPYLTNEIVIANFEFTKVITGAPELRPRWKRAVAVVESLLGEAIGKVYVQRFFPPEHKAKMDKLVANLIEAYRISITNLEWMSEETRQKALEKIEKFLPKIGFPEEFITYDTYEVRLDDLLGNVRRGQIFKHSKAMNKAGKPSDRKEWFMTPQTVNAYYHPIRNEIVFPAAILQPPFFDPEADEAWNYGGIGAVIGHEIGHGFDDQGSLFDGDGRINSWWTEEDRKRFEERTKVLIEQYDQYIPAQLADREDAESLHVKGALTIGENIGDLGGLAIAELAYELSIKEKGQNYETAPVIQGVTAIQRLFYAWALIWRSKTRDEIAIQYLSIDPHSPAEFRCNGVVKNIDSFYAAFEVKEGDGLYIAPEKRVRIWR